MANREKIRLYDNCFDWNIKLARAEINVIPLCSTPRSVRNHRGSEEEEKNQPPPRVNKFFIPKLQKLKPQIDPEILEKAANITFKNYKMVFKIL